MTTKELLQQALDALTRLSFLGNGDFPGNSEGNRIAQKAVSDIKQALAQQEQPAQKPDLWKTQFLTDVMTSAGLLMYGRTDKKLAQRIADGSARWRTELYTHPAPTQPALSDAWVPVTKELLAEQHPWLYEEMWIALQSGKIETGVYEWTQGRHPDRFIGSNGDMWAFDATHVMPIVKPSRPTVEAHCRGGV